MAGFQPYVDLDTRIGHCFVGALFPDQTEEGDYGVRIWSYENLGMILPEADRAYERPIRIMPIPRRAVHE